MFDSFPERSPIPTSPSIAAARRRLFKSSPQTSEVGAKGTDPVQDNSGTTQTAAAEVLAASEEVRSAE